MIRWSDDERAALEQERAELRERLRWLDVVLSPATPSTDELLDATVQILRVPGASRRPGVPALTPRVAEVIADQLADDSTGSDR